MTSVPPPKSVNYDDGQRLQALALAEYGVPYSVAAEQAGMTGGAAGAQAVRRLISKAMSRGYDPSISKVLKLEYVVDAKRSGRPIIATEDKKKEVVAIGMPSIFCSCQVSDVAYQVVSKDRNGREKPAACIGYETNLSQSTILRMLREMHYHPVKQTMKPGLTDTIKAARLKFALEHKDWTIDQWKDVIWTDETSVCLGQRRGKIRLWRQPAEKYDESCIRQRYKGFSEFMFWGAFSYDRKGPCHIWKAESAGEKKQAEKEIERLNKALEPIKRQEWELSTGMRRLGLRNKPGKKPEWRWNKQNGKYVRESKKGGIDAWRYQKVILKPLLIPFAQECKKDRPNMVVQEDGAPAHAHEMQEQVYMDANVMKMIWPGNSPDLNQIEPLWWYMKRRATRKGCPRDKKTLTKVWMECWQDLKQERLQSYVDRMPRHIARVIELEGGNSYREGSSGEGSDDIRPYLKEARIKAYRSRKAGIRPGSSGGLDQLEEAVEDNSDDDGEWDLDDEQLEELGESFLLV